MRKTRPLHRQHARVSDGGYLRQRARAAFLAMAFRLVGESFFARAGPPFTPPRRCGSVVGLVRGESFGSSPVEMSTISLASWFGSRGRFGRFGMTGSIARSARAGRTPWLVKLRHYPAASQ